MNKEKTKQPSDTSHADDIEGEVDVIKTDLELLSESLKVALDTPAIDYKRVKEIKAAIEQGAYEINPESIAEKLTEIEHLLQEKQ